MKVRRAKYYFSSWYGLCRVSDDDRFIPLCRGFIRKSYMSTWYSHRTGVYFKFSSVYPRCLDEEDKRQKLFTYNSDHHLLIKVETVYVLG